MEKFFAYYMLGDFETDFGYQITFVNGQVIEIYQITPLYNFSSNIPTQQEVNIAIDKMQKQYKNSFLQQEIFKKFDLNKDLFYLKQYIYKNEKTYPIHFKKKI